MGRENVLCSHDFAFTHAPLLRLAVCARSDFLGRQESWHATGTHTCTSIVRGRHKRELNARFLLNCGRKVESLHESLRLGRVMWWSSSRTIIQESQIMGFPSPCSALTHRNASRDYLPDFTTLNVQSTRHGAQPGPTLAPWCTRGPPACPAAASARRNARLEKKTWPMCEKSQLGTHAHQWGGPRGVTQVGMPQEKMSTFIQRHS